jgi:hypothetical protein
VVDVRGGEEGDEEGDDLGFSAGVEVRGTADEKAETSRQDGRVRPASFTKGNEAKK